MNSSLKRLMTASLLVLAVSPNLHAEDDDRLLMGVGLGMTGVAGAGSALTYSKLQAIYQTNSQAIFASVANEAVGLQRAEIPKIASFVGAGDELRITYMTSEAEERGIRIAQLEKRRIELRTQRSNARLRMQKANSKGLASAVNAASIEMRDLGQAIGLVDHDIAELKADRGSVQSRMATRVVDLNKTNLRDVEVFLNNKLDHGKTVLRIDRVPASKRAKAANVKAALHGQMAIMVFGAVVMLTQIGEPEAMADSNQEREIGDLYVPDLVETAGLN